MGILSTIVDKGAAIVRCPSFGGLVMFPDGIGKILLSRKISLSSAQNRAACWP
jgi:hypothetical protein